MVPFIWIANHLINEQVETCYSDVLSLDPQWINAIGSRHFKWPKFSNHSAEDQLCQYPGLTRGLVAVLLYYDGQRCLVQVSTPITLHSTLVPPLNVQPFSAYQNKPYIRTCKKCIISVSFLLYKQKIFTHPLLGVIHWITVCIAVR